jgi:hypothetical protein
MKIHPSGEARSRLPEVDEYPLPVIERSDETGHPLRSAAAVVRRDDIEKRAGRGPGARELVLNRFATM